MIRVLIADDHVLIREGLRKVFRGEGDIEVASEADNAADAVAQVRENTIDIAILDFNMPGRSGLDALAQIRKIKPNLPVLMLSMMPEREVALRALKAGASGFVSKESAAEEIVAAVRRVLTGKRYLSPSVADQLAAGLGAPEHSMPHEALSDREFQILRLIASGRSSRQVAEELSLSINTVGTYRRRIFEKLGLKSNVDITRYALEHRLLD